MFVPPYKAVLRALGITPQEIKQSTEVKVRVPALRLLIQAAARNGDFNEKGYLAANPDVAQALREGKVDSAIDHYALYGYFEDRKGAMPDVDEIWYRKANPDVAAAIHRKKLATAAEHHLHTGAEEFRAPSEAYQNACALWKETLATPLRK